VKSLDTDIFHQRVLGLLFIGTQTGLRGGELTILLDNCLKKLSFEDKHIGILSYRSTKNSKGRKIYIDGETFATSRMIEIIEHLQELKTRDKGEPQTEYLITIDGQIIKEPRLNLECQKFCIKHSRELGLINSPDSSKFGNNITYDGAINSSRFNVKNYLEINELKKGDILSLPNIQQFRVYFASEMRERGVDDRTISLLLNHQTDLMWGYYVRPKNELHEEAEITKNLIEEVVINNIALLGSKGIAIKQKIEKIVTQGKYNVEKDLDAIISNLDKKIEIRLKNGGFCIHSNKNRKCRYDSDTDEFLCAYGCCPNHCHTYFTVSITYQKYLEIIKVIIVNKANGFARQAEKEMYKLESVIKLELLPEMAELKQELSRNNPETLIGRHPSIEPIIKAYDNVIESIQRWQRRIDDMKREIGRRMS